MESYSTGLVAFVCVIAIISGCGLIIMAAGW